METHKEMGNEKVVLLALCVLVVGVVGCPIGCCAGAEGGCAPLPCIVDAKKDTCPGGQVCAGNAMGEPGQCYTPCHDNKGCAENEYCEMDRQKLGDEEPNHCRPKPPPCIVGAEKNTCPGGQVCSGNAMGEPGKCYTPCNDNKGCAENEYCEMDRQTLGDEEPNHCRPKP